MTDKLGLDIYAGIRISEPVMVATEQVDDVEAPLEIVAGDIEDHEKYLDDVERTVDALPIDVETERREDYVLIQSPKSGETLNGGEQLMRETLEELGRDNYSEDDDAFKRAKSFTDSEEGAFAALGVAEASMRDTRGSDTPVGPQEAFGYSQRNGILEEVVGLISHVSEYDRAEEVGQNMKGAYNQLEGLVDDFTDELAAANAEAKLNNELADSYREGLETAYNGAVEAGEFADDAREDLDEMVDFRKETRDERAEVEDALDDMYGDL